MDKQIIIDDVDVRGCEYLNTQNPKLDWSNCGHICKDTECKYKRLWWKKQYIRKEQECEALREEKAYTDMACEQLQNQLQAKEQECEGLKKEVQQALKKNAENYSNSCLLQKEVNQLKEQIKHLQEDLKIRCYMYFKESYRNYKLSEISCEWNARSSIEKLEKFLTNDDTLTDKIANISNEIKRFFKECTPNKDKRLADFIPEDEYTKCLKAQQQLTQLKTELEQMTALKDTYFACYHAKHVDLAKKYDELKAENKELKDKIKFMEGYITTVENARNEFERESKFLKEEIINRNEKIEELRFSVSDLTNRLCELNAEKCFGIVDLEQALQEIKEIAEHCMKQDICTTCDNSDKCRIEDEEIPTYDVCKLILQKISGVTDV